MPNTTKNDKQEFVGIEQYEELKKQYEEMSALLMRVLSNQSETTNKGETEEINPNKKTKVVSLTFGYFSLYAPNRGFLRFNEFGQSRYITYAQLVDYVNNCREAAEAGKFYIYNQDMVEELGLSETYERILNDTILTKILNGDNSLSIDLLRHTTDEQKLAFSKVIAEKVYNNEITDMNMIRSISDAIGIDIGEQVNQMKEVRDFIK